MTQKEIRDATARRLIAAREEARLSQREAGELAGFGKDAQSRVSNYERRKRNVSQADLRALAEVYGKNPVDLTFDVRKTPTEEEEERFLRKYREASVDAKEIIRHILDGQRHRKASKKGRERSG